MLVFKRTLCSLKQTLLEKEEAFGASQKPSLLCLESYIFEGIDIQ